MSILDKYGLSDRFRNESIMYGQLILARITSQHRGIYRIITDEGEKGAEISGKFRYETTELIKYPTVGDFVMVSHGNGNSNAIIHHILTRKSIIVRKAVGISGQVQPIAANIDTIFICMSLNNNYNLSRLERYLSVAWDSGATPVVVLTKSDLCENLETMIVEVEKVSYYSDVITISVYDEDVDEKFVKYLKPGTTSAFIGSSGVGKSTLINQLMGDNVMETYSVGRFDKGRHTTTGREMFISPLGGVLIDTPGMRELGAESIDLNTTFDDVEELAGKCRFHDCTHNGEPGCAIIRAIEDGKLDRRRLDNYMKLKKEVGYDGLNAKEIETKKLERMFKDVGGMKNVRKYIKDKRKF